jgi:hypothetical protein
MTRPASRPRTCHLREALVLGVGTLLAGGCAARTAAVKTPQPAREGRTSLRVLSQAPVPVKHDQVEVSLVPLAPGPENRLPSYPADALRAGCGSGAVAVRVFVGTSGRVTRQSAVPGHEPLADSCSTSFAKAVAATIGQWGFFPALRQTCRTHEVGASRCTAEPIESYVDVEFLFEVIAGRPSVHPR